MFKKILIPLDGSELAERALEPAIHIAEKFGGNVILLRVATPETVLVGLAGLTPQPYEVYDADLRRDQEEAEAYLNGIETQWAAAKIPIRTEVISGTPPEMIVEAAQAAGVDLVVMSTHGRSGLSRLIYGSVAEAVLRGARVPVLLIPLKA